MAVNFCCLVLTMEDVTLVFLQGDLKYLEGRGEGDIGINEVIRGRQKEGKEKGRSMMSCPDTL